MKQEYTTEALIKKINPKFLPLLFLTAYPAESNIILKENVFQLIRSNNLQKTYRNKEKSIYLIETGIGPKIMISDLKNSIHTIQPGLIINYGICGALESSIKKYNSYIVKEIYYLKDDNLLKSSPFEYLSKKIFKEFPQASLVTVDEEVNNKKTKNFYFNKTNCQLVDMEAFHLYKIASLDSIPIIFLKLVTDMADNRTQIDVKKDIKIWQTHLDKNLNRLIKTISILNINK
jgi:nucleoside phosphorylase